MSDGLSLKMLKWVLNLMDDFFARFFNCRVAHRVLVHISENRIRQHCFVKDKTLKEILRIHVFFRCAAFDDADADLCKTRNVLRTLPNDH